MESGRSLQNRTASIVHHAKHAQLAEVLEQRVINF